MFKNLDKTSVIGIVTCVVIMILLFMRMSSRNAEIQAQQQLKVGAEEAAAQKSGTAPAPSSPAPASSPSSAASASAPVAAPVASAPAQDFPADRSLPVGAAPRGRSSESPVEIRTESEAIYRIDPHAGVVGVELMNYGRQPVKGESAGPVVLGSYDYPFLALSSQDGPSKWQAIGKGGIQVLDGGKAVRATRLSTDGRMELTETWHPRGGGSHEVDYTVTFRNLSRDAIKVVNMSLELGALSPMMAGPGEIGYGGVAYMQPPVADNHSELIGAGDLKKAAKARGVLGDPNSTAAQRDDAREDLPHVAGVSWACVHTRYFMQGVKCSDPAFTFTSLEAFSCEGVPGAPESAGQERFRGRLHLPELLVGGGESETLEFTGIVGPMKLNLLRDKGIGLEGILGVDRFFWGSPKWMGELSRFFVNTLLTISRVFPGKWSLGFALVILTLAVKLIFWPLSLKSSRSMKKMQELQPQLKELREKYKSDPQEMYRRQQELFKENHVSQLGGCLPMLVQIPIFFALFNTFRGAIELRQASFLWAADLSLPDTVLDLGIIGLNPMAIIMVGTMLWQQKITPSGDPQQKRMMMMMSLVFAYFLYTQPSGLTLYMTVNQLLSMLQFRLLKKMDGKKAAGAPVTGAVAGK